MTSDKNEYRMGRRALLTTALAATGVLLIPEAARADAPADPGADPVHALRRAAHPLHSTEPGTESSDLRALGAMVGDATVVGLGEATHGSHEFFTMKQRVFRYLVEEKGFTTFALEMSWPAGVRIDEYLQHGGGDARQVVAETLGGSPWDREEFVSLIEWMRDHNRHHPDHPVHFVGDDAGFPGIGDAFFQRVTDYVRRTQPEVLPRINALYSGLRPLDDAFAYLGRPLAERQRLAANAQQAVELISGQQDASGHEYEMAVQNARSIAQTATYFSYDFDDDAAHAAANRYRDQLMADNVLWWQRHTGSKVLLSAHNGHVGYLGDLPDLYPRSQGSVLRDALGSDYVPIGFTFDQGSFLAMDATGDSGTWKPFTVGPAEPDTNEYVLDQVRHQDFYLDIRSASPAARAWLDVARSTRSIGTDYPFPEVQKALGRCFDVLIHLHLVHAAELPKQ
jgi:erythromycin esterase